MKTKKVSYFVEGRSLGEWMPVVGSDRDSIEEAAALIKDYKKMRPTMDFHICRETTLTKTEVVIAPKKGKK